MAAHHWLPFTLVLIAVQLYAANCTAEQAEHCEHEMNNGQSWNRMEVLPGIGWDNLRNVEMGEVFEFDYSKCQLTNDRKFLIPNGFFAIPLQQSNIETFAELIDHWDNHTSLTSASINAESKFFSRISGKLSADYTKAKMTMYKEKSFVARVQIRYKLYIIHLQVGANLHPKFKTRLLDMAAYMMDNNTNIAHYLAELLVRDYGTHYTTAVHAGAILVKEDYLKNTLDIHSDTIQLQIRATASAKFFGIIKFSSSMDYNSNEMNYESYSTQLTYSHLRTFGGPPYKTDFTLNDWEDGLEDSLVAIDREGDPLYYAIVPEALPELPPMIVMEIARYVEKAVNLYYKYNTINGCTQPDATNFYFAANNDDGSCVIPDSFTFAGVFQTCIARSNIFNIIVNDQNGCLGLLQKNPLTGDYSCPSSYEAVLLYEGEMNIKYLYQLHYSTYWCMATGTDQSGLMFGGLYNSMSANPITHSMSCPNYYHSLLFGEDTHICVSNDELGYAQSLPFGGFESCKAGNPLALVNSSSSSSSIANYKMFGELEIDQSNWPHRCPKGYSQHLASIEQSCDISYCVKAGSLGEKGLPPVRRLPFRRQPQHNANSSDVLSLTSPSGDLWLKNETTKEWYKVKEIDIDTLQTSESVMEAIDLNPASKDTPMIGLTNSSNITSRGTSTEGDNAAVHNNETPITVALVISSTALIGLIVVIAVYGVYKCKKPKGSQHGYSNIDRPVNTGNEMETNTDV